MPYRIVGLDPGKMSGLVAFTVDENQITLVESYELDLVGIGQYLDERTATYLAYEVANKFHASGHMSSEVIGIAKYFCEKKGIVHMPVTQSAHKKLITRDVLKRAGLYVPGTHAKDAAGVGLFFTVDGLNLMRDVLRPDQGE